MRSASHRAPTSRRTLRATASVSRSRPIPGGGLAAGDAILAQAADEGADLLVMGGYGHSRLREMVLGGVTRQLLTQMTLPVLLSH